MRTPGWKRHIVWTSLMALVLGMTAACSTSRPASESPSTRPDSTGTPSVEATRPITFVSLSNQGPGGDSERKGHLWLRFEVVNSSDSSLALPNRPRYPIIVAADGSQVDVDGSSARLVNGGGSFGPRSFGPRGGPPYLNPGGVLHTSFSVPADQVSGKSKRPLRVTYAPASDLQAEFVVP